MGICAGHLYASEQSMHMVQDVNNSSRGGLLPSKASLCPADNEVGWDSTTGRHRQHGKAVGKITKPLLPSMEQMASEWSHICEKHTMFFLSP